MSKNSESPEKLISILQGVPLWSIFLMARESDIVIGTRLDEVKGSIAYLGTLIIKNGPEKEVVCTGKGFVTAAEASRAVATNIETSRKLMNFRQTRLRILKAAFPIDERYFACISGYRSRLTDEDLQELADI